MITPPAIRLTRTVIHRRSSKQRQGKDAHQNDSKHHHPWFHDSLLHFSANLGSSADDCAAGCG